MDQIYSLEKPCSTLLHEVCIFHIFPRTCPPDIENPQQIAGEGFTGEEGR